MFFGSPGKTKPTEGVSDDGAPCCSGHGSHGGRLFPERNDRKNRIWKKKVLI